jgi:UDP-2,3-diacylglucosamine hydrolase
MTFRINELEPGKKVYFASDFHLGAPSLEKSKARERKIVKWLDSIKEDAAAILLIGDIFDFWFEYKHAIPKGFIRLQGKLAELTDAGIPVLFFTGNHDMWMFDYFPEELNIPILREPISTTLGNKTFYIGHGDGLGPGDHTYKLLKKVFNNKLCQWAFARIHPNLGIGVANMWSRRSRISNVKKDEAFLGEEEWLVHYCKEVEEKQHHDYYVFGHRHLPLDLPIGQTSRYINLGEWVSYCSYAVYDGTSLTLDYFEG